MFATGTKAYRGKAGAILRDVQVLPSKRAATGGKLTARDIQQPGPQLLRSSSEVARNALAAVGNAQD